ncbi:MFS transporter [Paenibacillus koleovorans]|uniref:MFS transporter n=1 Tax=Paenibacillus koleovorans TaxID=121608 RepID=UPI000FDA81EC|nr:MFS transporter [Paenibacillus koleovorans]
MQPPYKTPPLTLIKSVLFSYYAINATLLPYLPSYFGLRGYSAVEIGWLMNIGPFMAMFASPVWGVVSDRYRALKQVILLLWALAIAASIGLFVTEAFPAALLFVLLLYFFMSPSAPLLDTLVVRTVDGSRSSYGSVRLWGSIGFCVVAFASGYVLQMIGGLSGIPYLFWSLWIIPIVLLVILKIPSSSSARPVRLDDIRRLLGNKRLLWFLVLLFVIAIPHRMNDVMFTLVLTEIGVSDRSLGMAWFFAALSEIPTFALLGRYMHRLNELSVMLIATLLYAIRWIFYGFVDDPAILILLQTTHAITFAAFWIAAVQFVVRLVPEELGSTGQTVLSAVFVGLAGIVGGIGGGFIMDELGKDPLYYFSSVICVIGAGMLIATRMYWKRINAEF